MGNKGYLQCAESHRMKHSFISDESCCGPLSLISPSGIPCLEKMFFSAEKTLVEVALDNLAISGKRESSQQQGDRQLFLIRRGQLLLSAMGSQVVWMESSVQWVRGSSSNTLDNAELFDKYWWRVLATRQKRGL